uniref:Elongation factor Ts, mitochondrial n=1 Tax=Salix viminalis TaxID=40686 RepID=A0A6N2MTV0_SALVM
MALCRNVKGPLSRMLAIRPGVCYGQSYSTAATATPFYQSADDKTAFRYAFGVLSRQFSSQTPPAAAVQMNLIRQLRERTSAPIKDVKDSLVQCNWDIEAAQTDLRKRGKASAMKKAGRIATEGLLALAQNEGKAAVIELNCETDFVARNEIFQYLALTLAKQALLVENGSQLVSGVHPVGLESLEELKFNLEHPKISGDTTVHNAITEVAAMMGENVRLRRGFVMSAPSSGVLSTYLHTSPQPGLGRIAGLLSLEIEDGNSPLDALQRVGSELAVHLVAAKPLFLTKESVSSDALENEREILKSQAESTGKSQMAIEKMVEGRLRKYYEEVVLVEQKFVMNDTVNVKTLISNLSKEVGSPVKIGNFFRMEVGEGIQREEASSGDEPVAQAA